MNDRSPNPTRREKYCQVLYDLAEECKAKAILEVGLGWLVSGRAFADSLANRKPGRLVSLEANPECNIPADVVADYAAQGVSWSVVHGKGETYPMTGKFDLLYLDGPCHRQDVLAAWDNLTKLIKKGGLVVIDGAGEHLVEQGYPGIKEAIGDLEAKGIKFTIENYIHNCGVAYAHV